MGALVVVLAAATGIVFGASYRQNRGIAWADDVCSFASTLCATPGWMVVPTILLALFYLYRISLNT